MSTPVSTMPIVTPRPSNLGFAATNCGAPVSCVGMYAFSGGVFSSGGSTFVLPPSGFGFDSGIVRSTSIAAIPASCETLSAAPTGTETRR